MHKGSSTLMTKGPIWQKIVFFAIPIFIGNLFQQMYNTADSLIVGNFIGANALAAVSSSGNLIFLMIGFFNGVFLGAGVVISRYFGARKIETMQRAIYTTIATGFVAGIIMTIIGVMITPILLEWMGTPAKVMPESVSYFRIYFLGSLGFMLYNAFVGVLQAVGDSKHPLYYLVISSLVNIALDLFFVAVLHLGVGSAAAATAISQFISAILCLIQLVKTNEEYKINIKKIGFDKEMFKMIISYGIPSGLQNSIIAIANVVVQADINSFGEAAMAGCGAYSKIEGFAFLPISSFTLALTTFVGQNLGADKIERTLKGARFGILCSIILAEIVGIIMFIFAPQLINAFSNNADVVSFGTDRARTSALFFCMLAYSHSISAILRGAGKSKVPMLVMMTFWCIVRVAFLSLTMSIYHTIDYVYWVYPLTWTLSSAAFFIYYHKVDWMHGFE